jgi:hypothetical protein
VQLYQWRSISPLNTRPGCRCSQVKALPGSSAVTVYVPVGIRGCEISNRDPTARGPGSSGRRSLTESVQSGHSSTLTSTSNTRSGEAATLMLVSASMPSIFTEVGTSWGEGSEGTVSDGSMLVVRGCISCEVLPRPLFGISGRS